MSVNFQSTLALVVYKPVEGFPNYCVGSNGTVWSCRVSGPKNRRKERWSRLTGDANNPNKQLRVTLYCNGRRTRAMVHHLVLEAFIGPRPPQLQGLHGNGYPPDNAVDNLRWGTPKENMEDRDRHGRTARGERQHKAKLTEEDVRLIRQLYWHGVRSIAELALIFAISSSGITSVVNRVTWKHV